MYVATDSFHPVKWKGRLDARCSAAPTAKRDLRFLSLSCSACVVASHVGGVRQKRPPFTPSDWPRWELSSCASRADGMTPNEINGRLMGNGGSRQRREEARLLWLDTCAALAREAGRTRRCSVSCRRMTLRYFLRRSSQTRERAFYVLACFCVLK